MMPKPSSSRSDERKPKKVTSTHERDKKNEQTKVLSIFKEKAPSITIFNELLIDQPSDTSHAVDTETKEHEDSLPENISHEIIIQAAKHFNKSISKAFKIYNASYILSAVGNSLLQCPSIDAQYKMVKDPLAFRINFLKKKLFEKAAAEKYINERLSGTLKEDTAAEKYINETLSEALEEDSIGKLNNLLNQYNTEVKKIKEELNIVKTLHTEKEELNKKFGGYYAYIPKQLTETFISKYCTSNQIGGNNTSDRENNIIEDLKGFYTHLKDNKDTLNLIICHRELIKLKNDNNVQSYSTLLTKKKWSKEESEVLGKAKQLLNLKKTDNNSRLKETLQNHNAEYKAQKKPIEKLTKDGGLLNKIEIFKEIIVTNTNNIDLIIEKVENIIGVQTPKAPLTQEKLNQIRSRDSVQELHKHLRESYPYTMDSEYLNSLQAEKFLVQTRIHKKIGRDMMKSTLILSSGGYDKSIITVPPGNNTTLEIYSSGSTAYFIGEFGSYERISKVNVATLENLIGPLSLKSLKQKVEEFKYLFQVEAIRSCSALLTNAMFFQLATDSFTPYVSGVAAQPYSYIYIATQMPMAMEDAVTSSIYIDNKLNIPHSLKHDYRFKVKKNKDILAKKNNNILFDWICNSLKKQEEIFYTRFDKDDSIKEKFAEAGWIYGDENNDEKKPKAKHKEVNNEYELITNKITTQDNGKMVIITKIKKFPFKIFKNLLEDWYEIKLDGLIEGDVDNITFCGDLSAIDI